MATFNSNTSKGYKLTLTVTQKSQSTNNNTSTLSWKLTFSNTNNQYINSGSTDNFKVTINGKSVLNTNKVIGFYNQNSTITIGSGTTTVSHNNNGTKTVSVSFSFTPGRSSSISYYPAAMSGSGSMTLTTIPRASSFSSVRGTTIGGTMSVGISRHSTSFTHTVLYRVGTSGSWTTAKSSVTTSTSFTLPMSLCSKITNSTSGILQLCLRTYSGSSKIGSDVTKNVTVSVPTSVVPTVGTVTISEGNSAIDGFFGDNTPYVQGKSQLAVSITASGTYSSTIKSYKTEIEGKYYTASSFTSTTIMAYGTIPVKVTVTDSRGRTGTKTVNVTVVEHFTPQYTHVDVFRSTGGGASDDEGEYITIQMGYRFATINDLNNYRLSIDYRVAGSTARYTNLYSGHLNDSENDNWSWTSSNALFSVDNAYDVMITVLDEFTSNSFLFTVNTSYTLINFNSSGKGISFGSVSSEDNFTVDMESKFKQVSTFEEAVSFKKGLNAIGEIYVNGTVEADNLHDTGWVNCTYQTGFKRYGSTQPTAQVRRIGKQVYFRGVIGRTSATTPTSDTSTPMVRMPSGYAPEYTMNVVCQGSFSYRFQLSINSNGLIYVSRYGYGDSGNMQLPASVWLNCYATWVID